MHVTFVEILIFANYFRFLQCKAEHSIHFICLLQCVNHFIMCNATGGAHMIPNLSITIYNRMGGGGVLNMSGSTLIVFSGIHNIYTGS